MRVNVVPARKINITKFSSSISCIFVAIRYLLPSSSIKANMKMTSHVTRIKREVRLLQLLNHKNIVRLYEVAETNDDIILVMEYANGADTT